MGPKRNQKRDDRICKMFRQGITQCQLAKRLKITRQRVQQILQRNNHARQDGGRHVTEKVNAKLRAIKHRAYLESWTQKTYGCSLTEYNKIMRGRPAVKGSLAKKYIDQQRMAAWRGIPYKISFTQWRKLWLDSGHWRQVGIGRGTYNLCRIDQRGPYTIDNVHIIPSPDNSRRNINRVFKDNRHKPWGMVPVARRTWTREIAIKG